MRAIIMADGRSMRWYADIQEKFWGHTPKQLVEVNGEPILHRSVRLLKENSVEDIWITSHNSALEVEGANRYEPENNCYEIDKFYSPIHLWNKENGYTLFVYGDVFFTEDAMKKIIRIPTDDFLFFGRFHLSHFTGHGGEIFAVKVKEHNLFQSACLHLRHLHERECVRCGAWELYRLLSGATQLGVHIPYGNFIGIDDWTDDFDTPSHFENWLRRFNESYNYG